MVVSKNDQDINSSLCYSALQDIDYIDSVCVLYSTAPIAAQFWWQVAKKKKNAL